MRLKRNSLYRLMLPTLAQVALATGAGAADIKMNLKDATSSLVVNASDNSTRLRVRDNGSISMGFNTTASGDRSTAMGNDTIASGSYSTAFGSDAKAEGEASFAVGMSTTASGNYSTAMGSSTTASGFVSTASGYGSTASGYYSTASGFYTTASGYFTTAMGYQTTASDYYSTAMGASTEASGYASTASGFRTIASGSNSMATGIYTTADCYAQTTIGQYSDNSSFSCTNSVAVDGTPLFVIGNGTNNLGTVTRSNALVVYDNGTMELEGGLVAGTATVVSSDRRLKQNIVTLAGSLEKVQQLRGVSYEWIDPNRRGGRQIGFIAQEVQEVVPEVVVQNGDYLAMSYANLTAVLVEAVKEQQVEIEQVQAENDTLEAENDALEAQNQQLWGRLEAIEALLKQAGLLK